MKTVKIGKEIRRLSNEEATKLVESNPRAHYIPKKEWKELVRIAEPTKEKGK